MKTTSTTTRIIHVEGNERRTMTEALKMAMDADPERFNPTVAPMLNMLATTGHDVKTNTAGADVVIAALEIAGDLMVDMDEDDPDGFVAAMGRCAKRLGIELDAAVHPVK